MKESERYVKELESLVGLLGASKTADLLGVTERGLAFWRAEKAPKKPHPETRRKIHELFIEQQNGKSEDQDMTTMTMKPTFGEKKPAVTIEDLQKKIIALEAEKKTLQEMIDKLLQKR